MLATCGSTRLALNYYLTPSSFVERLLESDGLVWHRWDRDLPSLLDQLKTAARAQFPKGPDRFTDRYSHRIRGTRILWLLDRLTPLSDDSVFEPYLGQKWGVYAWGRRLPTERRDELTRIPLPLSGAYFRRVRHLQAAMFAWCDSCPNEQLTTLLEWREGWASALESHDLDWLAEPVLEFSRRCSDAGARLAGLHKSLHSARTVLQYPDEIGRAIGRSVANRSLWLLLEQAARENPGAREQLSMGEDWARDFEQTLSLPPFQELGEVPRDIFLQHRNSEYLAQSFWIWRHGVDQWKQLHDHALGTQEERVFNRLSEIVPPDELDAWDDLVLDQSTDHGEMRAYCRWLAPRYAELLGTHFSHPDRDWRACAYQNYLAKAPDPILQNRWRRAEDLPAWQSKLLDRRLFAPESIRPSAIVHDTQAVEADLRLEDPFNYRAF